jgi:beta-lactamase class A
VTLESLRPRLESLERESGARALSVAVYDTKTRLTFRHHADRWFHAASTIKVAILVALAVLARRKTSSSTTNTPCTTVGCKHPSRDRRGRRRG